jgi:hypothetical protein
MRLSSSPIGDREVFTRVSAWAIRVSSMRIHR